MTAAVDLIKALVGGWDASTLPSVNVLRSVSVADAKSTPKGATAEPKQPH
jgi:hypothetical protein